MVRPTFWPPMPDIRRPGLCERCAMSPRQRAAYPGRACPLVDAVADLCPYNEVAAPAARQDDRERSDG
jgi:hypothetical protein